MTTTTFDNCDRAEARDHGEPVPYASPGCHGVATSSQQSLEGDLLAHSLEEYVRHQL